MGDLCKATILRVFEYYTPKVVHLKNRKIGVLSRFIQLCIILYIAGYVLVWQKGYQAFSPIESCSVSKLKGIIYPNFTEEDFNPEARPYMHLYLRTWDSVDYTVDPVASNEFFVMTNVLITPNQVQGKCPEDFHKKGAICRNDSDCPQGHSLPKGNGVLTGSCVTSDWNDTYHVCEIKGWCPVERGMNVLLNNKAILAGTQDMTVFIKHFAVFTLFDIRLRNIPQNLKDFRCINSKEMPTCPIFRLKDIVPGDYDKIALKGAVVAMEIEWDCNFDYDPLDCIPKYNFRRLDADEKYAPGQNFRYAEYYSVSKRTIFKAYGIRFQIIALGRGGKFSVVPLLLNIGSGLGLLALTTVICDVIVLYCIPKRKYYYHKKYQDVLDQDAVEPRDPAPSNQDGGEVLTVTDEEDELPTLTEKKDECTTLTEKKDELPMLIEEENERTTLDTQQHGSANSDSVSNYLNHLFE